MTGRSAPGYHPFRSLHLSLPLSIPRVFLRFFLSFSSFFFFSFSYCFQRQFRENFKLFGWQEDRNFNFIFRRGIFKFNSKSANNCKLARRRNGRLRINSLLPAWRIELLGFLIAKCEVKVGRESWKMANFRPERRKSNRRLVKEEGGAAVKVTMQG